MTPGRLARVFIVGMLGLAATAGGLFPGISVAAEGPGFVQQASGQQLAVGTGGLGVTPASNVSPGNRLVVQTEMWSGTGATAASVTDSAGNTYVKLLSRQASDRTELSVWTAPITNGGATRPTITVKPTSKASMGIAVLEYSGLSPTPDATIVDQVKTATGKTSAAATVSTGATAALTTDNALVLGFYADSGFGATLTADPDYTQRVNTSPSTISDLLVEDRTLNSGTTPNPTVRTSPNTTWLTATLALKSASAESPPAP